MVWRVTHSCVGDFELSQDIQRHIVHLQWVDNEILIPCRAFFWPVLMAFLLVTTHQHIRSLHCSYVLVAKALDTQWICFQVLQ